MARLLLQQFAEVVGQDTEGVGGLKQVLAVPQASTSQDRRPLDSASADDLCQDGLRGAQEVGAEACGQGEAWDATSVVGCHTPLV
jgi:hypothetical protein